jgi:hypothetical protein
MKNSAKVILLSILIMCINIHANMMDNIKKEVKNLGKSTPINIVLYVKNPSTICQLTITNKINPYKMDITTKLKPIILKAGKYQRDEIKDIRKGAYEFEYIWSKDGKFVDSKMKTIRIFAYHNSNFKIYKKVNLSFLLMPPRECK